MAIVGLRNFETSPAALEIPQPRPKSSAKLLCFKPASTRLHRDGHLMEPSNKASRTTLTVTPRIINFGVVTDPAIVRDTVERMNLLKVLQALSPCRGTYIDPASLNTGTNRKNFSLLTSASQKLTTASAKPPMPQPSSSASSGNPLRITT